MKKMVEIYKEKNPIVDDAIDRIVVKMNEIKEADKSKSFLLTGCGTQNGTTKIAIDLAVALSIAGWRTLLVDCDIKKSMEYTRLNEGLDKGMVDFIRDTAYLDDIIYETNRPNLYYMPSGSYAGSSANVFFTAAMRKLTYFVANEYDYIIYDLPAITILPAARVMLGLVDKIFLVAGMEATTRKQVRTSLDTLVDYEHKYMGVILNKVDSDQYAKCIENNDYYTDKKLASRLHDTLNK